MDTSDVAGSALSRPAGMTEAATPFRAETGQSLDAAYRECLLEILVGGEEVAPVESENSVGAGRRTLERRNMSMGVARATDCIVPNSRNLIRATLAVGRFVWMMSGSNRLEDVRFYESSFRDGPRDSGVGKFSDDGISIPGSSYGARLFMPRPGLDQVSECIQVIRSDPVTRRAAMSVYQPEDAGRVSADIPCTFGVIASPRSNCLNMTVIMRSNNAWFLLPYNIFEFSLLGGIMASEVGMLPGDYHHFAVSMHLYEEHWKNASESVDAPSIALDGFGEMPAESLASVRKLCAWEAHLRHTSAGMSKRQFAAENRRIRGLFPEFWQSFAKVVLAKAASNAGKADSVLEIANSTHGPLGQLLRHELRLEELEEIEASVRRPVHEQLELWRRGSGEPAEAV